MLCPIRPSESCAFLSRKQDTVETAWALVINPKAWAFGVEILPLPLIMYVTLGNSILLFFFFFLGPHLQHMEFPR